MVTQKESYSVEDNEIILNIINKSIYRKLYSIGEYLEKFQDNKWYYVGNNSFFESYSVEDNEIILNIINKSIYRKLYSIGEYLEKFQDNKWYYVGNNSFFEPAAILPHNKINDYKVDINRFKYFKTMKLGEEGISISKLTPGKYRILKPFYSEENQRDIYLSAEFNVE